MKLRVLHVIDHLGLGGAQTVLYDLLSNGNSQILDQEVATLHGEGPFFHAFRKAGWKVYSLSRKRWPPYYLLNLPKLLTGRKYDILHFHLQASNWLAKPLAALFCNSLRVAHDHTSGDLNFRGYHSILPDAVTHFFFSNKIFAVSPAIRDFLCCWEALPKEMITVIKNGVNLSKFYPPSPMERAEARAHFRICENEFIVGAMGRLAPEKNFAFIAKLASVLPNIRFIIAGDGPLHDQLIKKFAPLGGRVQLLGRIDARLSFFHAIDCFILPSLHEGLPMVLLEAMACALPIVASRLPDISNALAHAHEGLLAEPGNLQDFYHCLKTLINQQELRKNFGSAALTKCKTEFSAELMSNKVLCEYQKLINNKNNDINFNF